MLLVNYRNSILLVNPKCCKSIFAFHQMQFTSIYGKNHTTSKITVNPSLLVNEIPSILLFTKCNLHQFTVKTTTSKITVNPSLLVNEIPSILLFTKCNLHQFTVKTTTSKITVNPSLLVNEIPSILLFTKCNLHQFTVKTTTSKITVNPCHHQRFTNQFRAKTKAGNPSLKSQGRGTSSVMWQLC